MSGAFCEAAVKVFSVLGALLLISSMGCSEKPKAGKPAVSSLQADYQLKAGSFESALSKAAKTSPLSYADLSLLIVKATELRDLVPIDALTEKHRLDNLVQSEPWMLPDQPVVRIERVESWVVCHSSHTLTDLNLSIKDPVTGGHWERHISPAFDSAYSSAEGPFDYEHSDPQFSDEKAEIVTVTGAIHFDGDLLDFAGNDCSSPRRILEYSSLSERDLKTVKQWKLILNEIVTELNQLSEQETPSPEILLKAEKQIQAALIIL